MNVWHRTSLFVVVLLLCMGGIAEVHSQNRYGGGLQLMGSTVLESVGPGIHVRTSFPMNYDLSFAVGTTFSGFLFQGADQAAYALDPEASLVVTVPDPSNSSPYFLGGVGYHLPLGEGNRYETLDVVGGPTFHVGLGKVWQHGSTSLYVELTPTLFFRRERTDVLLPLRGGIIF